MTRAILFVLGATRIALVLGSGIFILVLLWGVFSRYVLNAAVPWIDELAIFLMIWLVFLGIGVAAHERAHIGMLAARDALPPAARRGVVLLGDLLMIAFLAVAAYEGTRLAVSVIPQRSAALRLSFFWPYLSIPVGAALMILQLLLVGVRDFRGPGRGAGGAGA
jgi:TRAP-type C4-dicarboxylate transport system permease small subunit